MDQFQYLETSIQVPLQAHFMLMLNQVKKIILSQYGKRNPTQKIQPKNMHHVEYIILNHLIYLNFLQKNY